MGRRGQGLCRSSGISLEPPGRGEPTPTKHHMGWRMGRRGNGFCRAYGISLETPGRGELSRTKDHMGMRLSTDYQDPTSRSMQHFQQMMHAYQKESLHGKRLSGRL